ncbi:MAG: YceI family protein [Bacteroidales bacterium]|nr:YceI family protein [Bacteroidales bacterium]
MKNLLLIFFLAFLSLTAGAQKYAAKNGFIGFFSHTPIEDIKADNNQVVSILDISTGEIAFQVPIRSFRFRKALMEEHFNENYLESAKFPRSTFTGKILNHSAIEFTREGRHEVTVEGNLTIRDVTRKITEKGIIEITSGGINAESKFIVATADYGIKIPTIVRNNIAKTIEVTVRMKYLPM